MDAFLRGEYRVTQRSAWVVSICADRYPELIGPHLGRMIARMRQPLVHEAVRRNVVRILERVAIPARLQGTVATVCFDYLASADASIAVKVFSMTVLARIAAEQPDLGRELRLEIERQLPYASSGFRSRARRVMEKLGNT